MTAPSENSGLSEKNAGSPSQFGQIRNIPAPTERLDQKDSRIHTPPLDVGLIPFVCQSSGLRSDDLKISIHAALVSVPEELEGLLRGDDGLMLLASLRFEDTECGQVVLYLLECSQRRLAIIRNRCVEARQGGFGGCPPPSGIKEYLCRRRTNCPKVAGPVQPVGDGSAFESPNGIQNDGWKERRTGDANLFVRHGDAALSRGNIRPPLQQL